MISLLRVLLHDTSINMRHRYLLHVLAASLFGLSLWIHAVSFVKKNGENDQPSIFPDISVGRQLLTKSQHLLLAQ